MRTKIFGLIFSFRVSYLLSVTNFSSDLSRLRPFPIQLLLVLFYNVKSFENQSTRILIKVHYQLIRTSYNQSPYLEISSNWAKQNLAKFHWVSFSVKKSLNLGKYSGKINITSSIKTESLIRLFPFQYIHGFLQCVYKSTRDHHLPNPKTTPKQWTAANPKLNLMPFQKKWKKTKL